MRLTREAVSLGTRVTLTGLLLGAACLTPLVASAQPPTPQPGATGTVEIKDDKKKPTAAATPPPLNVAKKATSDRDPFVNYAVGGTTITHVTNTTGNGKLPGKGGKVAKPEGPPKDVKPVVEIPPPQVTVQGILLSGTGNRAILTSPNQTYIVKSGDKLGDYKVDSVTAKVVVFRFKDKQFKLKLKDEFSAMAGAPKGGKKK